MLTTREEKRKVRPSHFEKKVKIISWYGAGILAEIVGAGVFLYSVSVAELSFALFLTAPTIIFGIIFLAYAEHLRRKFKRTEMGEPRG